ncbi:protein of unknown function [Maridesulfovibrio hydrothermalis AM13 = DSM 14728]|uniref:Uncharacterized protein n=1 Tax=Maridesulfovibrio hydrothermalis AM13 = DSM 14728 TaxID=1121451 RepID=L0RFE7_9BACT|nr:protein of unknown function [Maridesulfovibrio hydrothermalis AM13 = DSM 14728]
MLDADGVVSQILVRCRIVSTVIPGVAPILIGMMCRDGICAVSWEM